mgnify:FL=1
MILLLVGGAAGAADPETVRFPSRDGRTELVAYLFKPATAGPHAAVVMLHGRAGSYSSARPGLMEAHNLTARNRMWGAFWAERGYLALHVDSFGPRGYARGFPRGTYSSRPGEINEQTVRPLDAYGALDWLRTRGDVIKDRIGLQGWSNGGMTTLAAVSGAFGKADGFRAALAQYPGCGLQDRQGDYLPQIPLMLLLAGDDDEVSPVICHRLARAVQAQGGPLEVHTYPGAHHSYDDPGKTKQSHAPNAAALMDTRLRAEAFFVKHLRP